MFALSSDDIRCAALRNLLQSPPPSDEPDNKEKFAAALAMAVSAMPAAMRAAGKWLPMAATPQSFSALPSSTKLK